MSYRGSEQTQPVHSNTGIENARDAPDRPAIETSAGAAESRAQKTESPHASKVFTNKEPAPLPPIKPTDDPVDVLNKARMALYQDTAHTCIRYAAGNSGPGWTDNRIVQVAPGDRMQISISGKGSPNGNGEWILIGKEVYRKAGSGPWEKVDAGRQGMPEMLKSSQFADVFKFRFDSGPLQFRRQEMVKGAPAFLYEDLITAGDMKRSIRIWVGVDDHLPRRTEMHTVTTSWGSAPVVWDETFACSYGTTVEIKPPI